MPSESPLKSYKYHLLFGAYAILTAGAIFRVARQPHSRNVKAEQIETIVKATSLAAVIVAVGIGGGINRTRSERI